MSININKKEKHAEVVISAEKLDALISPELKSELVKVNSEGFRNIILDLSEARYCDSSGLSAILVGSRLCKGSEGVLILVGLQEAVMKLITISQLDTVLNIVPTLSEAVDFMIMSELENDMDQES